MQFAGDAKNRQRVRTASITSNLVSEASAAFSTNYISYLQKMLTIGTKNDIIYLL